MPLLKDILYEVNLQESSGDMSMEVEAVSIDSRTVRPNSLYAAIRGTQVDGHQFISDAIEKGATAIVCEEYPQTRPEEVAFVLVKNARVAFGQIAANFYENPSRHLELIGVTGTNGKTTVATLLYEVFTSLGHKCGLLSTVEYRVEEEVFPSTHTTPDVVGLNQMLQKMVARGCTYCFMEVSSHAIDQDRIEGLRFSGAIFTNLSHDHLDYHGSFDAYLKAKKRFFDFLPSGSFALVNADDKRGKVMVQNTQARKRTYALRGMADYKAKILHNTFQGMEINIDGTDVWSKLVGEFNAYNILAVYGASVEAGEIKEDVLTALSEAEPASGRFEKVHAEGTVTGIVDYAHTPDALKNVLRAIQKIRSGNENVITVVGCGGDRDREKRPLMAAIACQFSDKVILTSDNPRSEDPEEIIREMKEGIGPTDLKKTLSLADRAEAIKTACMLAEEMDIVLVAGKGHEDYQEIKGEKLPFDDRKILSQMLKERQS